MKSNELKQSKIDDIELTVTLTLADIAVTVVALDYLMENAGAALVLIPPWEDATPPSEMFAHILALRTTLAARLPADLMRSLRDI